MSDDLVQRLRGAQEHHNEFGTGLAKLWGEAAARIAELEAENARLRQAVLDAYQYATDGFEQLRGAPGVSETHTDPKEAP